MNNMACATEQQSNYFCHQCQIEIRPNLPDFTCPTCDSGFIEEVTARLREDRQQSSASTNQHLGIVVQNLLFPTLPHDSDDMDDDMEGSDDVPLRLRRNRRGRSDRMEHFTLPFTHSPSHRGMQAMGGERSGGGVLDALVQQLLTNLLGENNLGSSLTSFQLHADPNDYVFGDANFDNLITQLMNRLDSYGPAAATSADISSLGKAKVTAAQVADKCQCSVCFDEYSEGEEVTPLPCQHTFHRDCIVPWLERHGTCPICRKTLSGQDTTTNEYVASPADASDPDNAGPSSRPT